MKNNLVKLLAVGALIASLGACGKKGGTSVDSNTSSDDSSTTSEEEVPQVVDIAQFYELEMDEETYEVSAVLDGKLVTLEGHTIVGYHGRTVYTSFVDGDYVSNLHGVEFRLADDVEFDWASAQRDVVDVTGRVAYENGICVLNDATYEVVTEGVYTQGQGWNNPCYYCPGSAVGDRSGWDRYTSTYALHSVVSEGTFQIATAPTWVDGQDTTFYVVFPGEDPDVENPDNLCPIKVTVPGDLVAAKRAAIKEVLDTVAVGEYFYTMFLFNYSSTGTGLMLDNYWGASYIEKATDVNIITSYADAAALAEGYYADPLPDLGIDEFALSYSVNTEYANDPLTDIWQDPSALGFTADQIANWAWTDWNVNVSSSRISAAIEAFGAKMTAAGFVAAGSEDGTTIWVATEGEGDDEVETAVVYEFDGASNIEWYYVAARGEGGTNPGGEETDARFSGLVDFLYKFLTSTGNSVTKEALASKVGDNTADETDPCYYYTINFGSNAPATIQNACASIFGAADSGYTLAANWKSNADQTIFMGVYAASDDDTVVYEVYIYVHSSGVTACQISSYFTSFYFAD